MANGAKVSLIGRLIKDPQQKNWQGTTVVSFTIAVNTTKKEGDKYISDLYNISVWGKSGEFIFPRVEKGTMVSVHGDLILQTYNDKNGAEQKALAVRASDVIPLTSSKKDSPASSDNDDGPVPF